jgi:tRNA dimethylallyltransferase
MNAAPQEWPVVAIAGPTTSGKTAAALAVAARWPVEIVSVDSALVYRGMDIGTAKPGRVERERVPHHLIDILDPAQTYSAARFATDAQRLVSEIRGRNRMPLLAGGTMLYLKALVNGLDPLPAADAAVRAALAERASREGWPALHAELQRVDPATAARLAPNDAQRIQRALEVWQLSGRPLSSHYRHHYGEAAQRGALENLAIVSLEPQDRAWLHARIAQRFDVMLEHGFVDEVLALRARGDLSPQMPSMRCVGYRQAWEALDAGDPAPLRERGIAATRQLAKRQLTWLRSMPARRVVACDADGAVGRVIDEVALRWPQTERC